MNKIRGSIDPAVIGIMAIFIIIITSIISLWLVIFAGTAAGAGGNFGKVMLVIQVNTGFWILFVIGITFGLYRKLTNPEEFAWKELPIQLSASTLSTVLLFCLFFSTSAKLSDTEIWNGYVDGAEYYEEWTERFERQECTGYDKDGNCKGYRTVVDYVYHPASWNQLTTVGNFGISRNLYRTFVQYFNNEKKENLFRPNQSSVGDGDKFYVTFNPKVHKIIPASRPHWYINYLQASDSIKKVSGSKELHKENLLPYPQVYSGKYGEIEFDRVIQAGVKLPSGWKNDVDLELDTALTTLGHRKQVNILVYVVNSADQSFVHALEELWVNGKKNDVIVVIGCTEFPKTSFVYVMAWTKVEEFKINLRNKILNLENIADGKALANIIIEEVSKSPESGGYERMPMSELEYLIADIRLPWWCQLVIVLVGAAVSWGVSTLLIQNEIRER